MKFITTTFARILYALPFVVFGFNHFRNARMMKNYVPAFFPAPIRIYLVYLTGAALIAAALAIITKIQVRLACLLLALMLAIFIATMHIPGFFKPETESMAMMSLLKDTSLAAAALFIAGTLKRG